MTVREYIGADKPHKHAFRLSGHNLSQNFLGIENIYYCECGAKLVQRTLDYMPFGSAPVKL